MTNSGRTVEFRFDILRNDIPAGTLLVESATINADKNADIGKSMQITAHDTDALDLLSDKIRPVMRERTGLSSRGHTWAERRAAAQTWAERRAVGLSWFQRMQSVKTETWKESALGVYIPETPQKTSGGRLPRVKIECYDVTIALKEDSLTERLFFAAGTKYIDAVTTVLISTGINMAQITPSDKLLTTDREFEIGTTKLSICNTLLAEINYNPVRSDALGAIVIAPYKRPTMSEVKRIYRADEMSIIAPEVTQEIDLYGVPNVFIAKVSNPDMDADLVSIYVNDNPASQLSTVRRGRRIVSEVYQPDAIASQEDLNDYIGRIAFEASQTFHSATIKTQLLPDVAVGDIIMTEHPELAGVFEIINLQIDLKPGGGMTQDIRRLVSAW